MLALAILGAAAAAMTALPGWLRYTGSAGGFGLPESVDITFGHLIDALDTEFRRLGAVG